MRSKVFTADNAALVVAGITTEVAEGNLTGAPGWIAITANNARGQYTWTPV
ncbi:hypothetical protein [Kutzneria sp. NPDC052558]|uniref:hypothetical protein n=1 Tax=Kutzneria sp. NPDC052558 TaxID=3364121 RepID=UPI0037CC308B